MCYEKGRDGVRAAPSMNTMSSSFVPTPTLRYTLRMCVRTVYSDMNSFSAM